MEEIILHLKDILRKDRKKSSREYAVLGNKYLPKDIDAKNFHEILPSRISNISKNNSMLFVDGGSMIIFESAGLCLGMIRLCAVLYSDNKRIKKFSKEFSIILAEDEKKIAVKTFPPSYIDEISFDADDEILKNGSERAECSKAFSLIRRIAEISYAAEISSNNDTDYIVLDGTLEAKHLYEKLAIAELVKKKNACAISKTCSIITNIGDSFAARIFDIAPSGCWYYTPIATNNNPDHPAQLYFAKLSANSDYAFRIDVQNGFEKDIDEMFSAFSKNSTDPVFPGYPYGLIDADSNARISLEEKRMLKAKILMKLGEDSRRFEKLMKSMDAHDILDNMRF